MTHGATIREKKEQIKKMVFGGQNLKMAKSLWREIML